jgi:nucleoside-diphosphate-sugar epimerase
VVDATHLAAQAPASQAVGQVFNIGSGRSVSVNELWDRITTLTGVPVLPRYAEGPPGEVRHSLAEIEKARDRLGYAPAVDFDEGLRRSVGFYEESRRNRRRRRTHAVGHAA